MNEDVLSQPRGAGYWLWKPYIIYEKLMNTHIDDVVFYTDAGVEMVNDIKHIIDFVGECLLFGNHYFHEHWCKGNVTDAIVGERSLGYGDGSPMYQIQASAMLFRNSIWTRNFVKKWLLWSQMPGFIDDSPGYHNHEEFKEHRHDQAILTCLAVKERIQLHWWPAMYNDGAFHYEKGVYYDKYPIMFHHHRKRNEEWKQG